MSTADKARESTSDDARPYKITNAGCGKPSCDGDVYFDPATKGVFCMECLRKKDPIAARFVSAKSSHSDITPNELLMRVYRWLWRYAKLYADERCGLTMHDLHSEFSLAVLKMAHRYDPARAGVATWAKWICRTVADHLRKQRRRECQRLTFDPPASVNAERLAFQPTLRRAALDYCL